MTTKTRPFAAGSFALVSGMASFAAPAVAVALSLALAAPALGDVFTDIGYTALVARLGGVANVPSGAGYGIGQVEAEETGGNYGPDVNNGDFAGTTFTPMTGPFGVSNHATTVGLAAYGNSSSVAPGVTNVWIWSANLWVTTNYLKTNQGPTPPALPPAGLRIFNHSWVGSFGGSFLDNDGLRRLDFAIQRDNLMVMLGTNNGAGSPGFALLAYGYNGITVGVASGAHCNALTPAGLDGPNRRKPEIVAPAGFTSFSTPIISAASALLLSTTDADAGLAVNPNADKSIVIKSVLLAGATHRAGWSNGAVTSGATRGTTSTPLDPLYGADLVNVDRSHLILTGQEHDALATVPAAPSIDESGWDYIPTIAANSSVFYRFRLFSAVPEVSILATWNRSVASNFGSFNLMDIDLTLWSADGTSLQTLIGDPGLPVFSAGDVSSTSLVDNIEHLYVKDLQPGDYVIELKRKAGTQTALPVALAWYIPKTTKFGDLNGDDVVDAADLAILLGAWGTPGPGDLNGDGVVTAADLAILLGAWG